MDMAEGVRAMGIMAVQATVVVMTPVLELVMAEQVGCMEGEAIVAVVGTIPMQGRKRGTLMQLLKLCHRSHTQDPLVSCTMLLAMIGAFLQGLEVSHIIAIGKH